MKVDRRDLQGNILRGYHFPHAAYLFVSVRQAEAGRRLLGELIEPVITEEEWGGTPPPWTLNVALTARGLKAVGLEKEARRRFPSEFRRGMRAKAVELGDVGKSAPEFWDKDLRSRDAHLLLTIYAPEADVRSTQLARWKRRVETDPGLRPGHEQVADQLPEAREHFGFADGFSQPAVAGSGRTPRGEGVLLRFGRWREMRLGEFVLGHRDEDGVVPGRDNPLLHNGTFMVWRKLEQNVRRFKEEEEHLAVETGARRSGSRRRSWGAGPTATRSCAHPTAMHRAASATSSSTATTSVACAVRSERTCGAPTRATPSGSGPTAPNATGCYGAACPTGRRWRRDRWSPTARSEA